MSAIFIHDADSILPDSIFLLPYFEKVRQKPRTLECVLLVFVIKTNIENFTNNLKVVLSAFQIVKELDFLMKTIFKDSFLRTLKDGGAMRDRTADLLRARQALSQLSYSPIKVSILSPIPWERNWWV